MKLNLIPPPQEPKIAPLKNKNTEISPIGWWKVTTEGDCEGRSTVDLGLHYGHVAEIALSLDVGPYYSYYFRPIEASKPSGKRPKLQAKRKSAWVSLSFHSCHNDLDARKIANWLDCPELTIKDSLPSCKYYSAFNIEVKDWK
jgi:hypothetical protein